MKTPKCKHCSGEHYSTFCYRAPRKPLPSYTKPLQRKKPKAKSTNPRPIAIEKLDRVFSLYIRLKDAKMGVARCVTCGVRGHYKSMQNGHFLSRYKMSVRWDEMNCHVQCPTCNEALGGNPRAYKLYMLQTYGEPAVEQLIRKSRTTSKLSVPEIERQVELYTAKLQIIQKQT